MSTNPPPKGGTVLLYENVMVTITEKTVKVDISKHDGSHSEVVISQESGLVIGGSNIPA